MARERVSPGALGVFAVMVGGAAGALLRAACAEAFPHAPGRWPWATFVANIAGALLLASAMRLTPLGVPSRYWRLLVGTGFCGALTTFSALQVETIQIVRAGRPGVAAAYAATSIAVGMGAVVSVTMAGRRRRHG